MSLELVIWENVGPPQLRDELWHSAPDEVFQTSGKAASYMVQYIRLV